MSVKRGGFCILMEKIVLPRSKAFENKKYFVLDMDGTFYLGDRLLDGSLEFISYLEESGCEYVFFTNNSSKSAMDYVRKLYSYGLAIKPEKVITSGMVTIKYVQETFADPKVFLLGTEALEQDFIDSGIRLVDDNPDIVIAGFDTTLTYDKLSKACTFIREGCVFLATHPDFNCPTESGFIPDCGAICAFITASTGKAPKSLGKPYRETLEYLLEHFRCEKDEMVFVGDRLYTDIAIGVNHNVTSVLVLTGETKLKDLMDSEIKPDIVVNRLYDIIGYIRDIPQNFDMLCCGLSLNPYNGEKNK
jgi:HAD superfamily hydrolase (TIGR01457 family)